MGAKPRKPAIVVGNDGAGHFERLYRSRLATLRSFVADKGWAKLTAQTRVGDIQLGQWVSSRRRAHVAGTLPQWVRQELESIPGWQWDPNTAKHTRNLDALQRYIASNQRLPRRRELNVDGADLRAWTDYCRRQHAKNALPQWLVAELEALPNWTWQKPRGRLPKRTNPDPANPSAAELIANAATKLGKEHNQVIDEVAALVTWIDKLTDEKRDRLPPEVLDARRKEGWVSRDE